MSPMNPLTKPFPPSRTQFSASSASKSLRIWTACIPGVAVGVLAGDQESAVGFGVTSVENPLPITADTLFQIGSITKTFVATAIMRLVENDKLDLDAPVRSWLPGLSLFDDGVAQQVTLRHLLTHTGGWVGDYFNDFGSGDDALARMVAEVAELPQLAPWADSFLQQRRLLPGRPGS